MISAVDVAWPTPRVLTSFGSAREDHPERGRIQQHRDQDEDGGRTLGRVGAIRGRAAILTAPTSSPRADPGVS